jgi:hypothetical protein
MEKKERFNKLIRYIIWAYDVPFQSALKTIAEKVGVGHSNLSSALRGNETYLTDNLVTKVNYAYGEPFQREWLLFGTGNMLKDNTQAVLSDPASIIADQQETIKSLSDSLSALTVLLRR